MDQTFNQFAINFEQQFKQNKRSSDKKSSNISSMYDELDKLASNNMNELLKPSLNKKMNQLHTKRSLIGSANKTVNMSYHRYVIDLAEEKEEEEEWQKEHEQTIIETTKDNLITKKDEKLQQLSKSLIETPVIDLTKTTTAKTKPSSGFGGFNLAGTTAKKDEDKTKATSGFGGFNLQSTAAKKDEDLVVSI